ncbi:MAG: DUF1552 domain-containing protein [Alphaproteobacteria bacterium]|nr:DUF1552 domain-containing protein [Alphaproteobacteria bacterium]
MSPRVPRLSRRALLRGLGGTALALPWLEAMAAPGASSGPPLRYVLGFGGFSLCADVGLEPMLLRPTDLGNGTYAMHTVARSLQDLAPHVSWVTGLRIPEAGSDGVVPPGGRRHGAESFHFHQNPLLAGIRQQGDDHQTRVTGPSTDQIVADHLGSTTFRSLQLRGQVERYAHDATPEQGILSYRKAGDGVAPLTPQTSPQRLFEALTGAFLPSDPSAAAVRQAEIARRRSVLDLVDREMGGVVARLSTLDRQRLEQHWQELRELETRLSQPAAEEGGACVAPQGWSSDPAGGDGGLKYAGEHLRLQRFAELLRFAFACDLTRVATVQQTFFAPMISASPMNASSREVHLVIHQGPAGYMAPIAQWHLDLWGHLLRQLRDTPEGDGSLLDHTAALYVIEGGYGLDTGGDKTSSHKTEEMMMLVAGRAGGMRPGRHLRALDLHPVQVMIGAMQRVGVPVDAHGQVEGAYTDL